MKNCKEDFYSYFPRPKKVKHVHFIMDMALIGLERDVNAFADEHPEYKILGIKLMNAEGSYIASITYLCDAPSEFDNYDCEFGDDDEEEN